MSYIPDDEIIENDAIEDNAGTRNASEGATVVSVVDEPDEHGGTIRYINAVSLEGDTVSPDVLLRGYTAHNALGQPITGEATGGGSGGTRSRKWVTGEIITAEKLNSMEDYVADAISMIGQSNVIIGSGAPTSSTQAEVGQLYADVTDGYNLYVCIEKTPGEGTTWYHGMSGYNTAVVYLYKRSASEPTIDWTNSLTYNFANKELTSVPFGWSMTIPSGREPLYVTAATAYSNMSVDTIDYTEWSAPVILSRDGSDGTPGESGMNGLNVATVFLYQRSSVAPQGPREDIYYTFSSGAVSGLTNNWVKNIPTSDGNPCYVIQATASSSGTVDVIESSEWSSPVILVEDGVNGSQGPSGYNNAIIYLYQRSDTAPSVSYVGDITYTFADDSINFEPSGWKRNIDEIGSGTAPIWVTAASASSNGAFDTIASNEWSEPIILSRDGANGSAGYNNAIIYLYQRSETAPAVSYLGDITYTFADDSLNAIPSGWYRNLGLVPSSQYPMWVTAASASSTGPTDTIEANEWSAPIILAQDGADGSRGANGTNGLNVATVFLYQRASTTPQGPSASITYTFATGEVTGLTNNWVKTVPTSHGDPCYVIQATAANTEQSDTIDPLEWSAPIILVEDGAPGSRGPAGYNNAIIYLYQRNTSTPADISYDGTIRYTFASDELNQIPAGWYRSLDDSHMASGIDPIWVVAASASSNDTYDDIAANEWTSPIKMAQNGADGSPGYNNAIIYLYKRSSASPNKPSVNSEYTFATNTLNPTSPSGWQRDISDVEAGTDPIWLIAASASSTGASDTISAKEWSAPVMISKIGADGNPGHNTATIYLYQRATSTPNKPSSDLTYTFSSKSLSNGYAPWSLTIPSGTDPIYITAATAYSSTDQDTIAWNEWSAPQIFAQSGGKGNDGLNSATVFLYQRLNSTPDKPTNTIRYTFADGSISSAPNNGWKTSIHAANSASGVSMTWPCYIIQATAISTETYDDIPGSEFSTPTILVENGDDGTNVATIFLYKRASSVPSGGSAAPSGNLNYEFSSGELTPTTSYNGWSKEVPALGTNGYPCYVIQATALSTGTSDTIETSEWSDPAKLLDSGTGINSVTTTYGTSASATTRPTSWSPDLPTVAEGQYLWTMTVTDYTDESVADTVTYTYTKQGTTGSSVSISSIQYQSGTSATTAPTGTWSNSPVAVAAGNYLWTKTTYSNGSVAYSVAKQGANGNSITVSSIQYQSGTSATTAPTGTWSNTPVTVAAGNYLWTKTTFSDNSVAYGIARQGTNGSPGLNSATVFLYQRKSTVPDVPSGNVTYTFSTGNVDNLTNGWKKSLKEANSASGVTMLMPCYIIQATAASTGDNDTIAKSEWSDPAILVEGGAGINSVTVTYGTSSSASTQPTSWQNSIPTVSEGQYLWVRTVTDYTDDSVADTVTYTYSKQGATGSSVSISSIQYQSGTSATTAPTGTWSNSPVAVAAGNYLWTKTTYSNGSVAYSVAKQGANGNSITVSSIQYQSGTSATTAPTGTWSNTPVTVAAGNYLWTKTTFSDGSIAYGIARQGTNGSPGRNTAIIYLYRRSTTNPGQITYNGNITYKFSDNTLSSIPTNWYRSLADNGIASSTEPIWISAATASSITDEDTIASSEWSSPVLMAQNGTNGDPGSPGNPGLNSATVFLYQRKATAPTSKCGTQVTYTFSTGKATNGTSSGVPVWNVSNGWYPSIAEATNASGINASWPCYVIQATATSVTDTDTIPTSEWSNITLMVENGINVATVSLYQRGASAPSKPGASSTYTFSTGQLSGYSSTVTVDDLESGYWSGSTKTASTTRARTKDLRYITKGSKITYTITTYDIQVYILATQSSTSTLTSSWRTSSGTYTVTQNGYLAFNIRNHSDTSATVDPTAWDGTISIEHIGGYGAWAQTPPASDGNPCYITQATASNVTATDTITSSEWSTPSVFVGAGNNGYNTAIAYLYKRSGGTTAPTINWTNDLTYSFVSKSITSTAPSGWSKTIPSTGTDPLYVTTATAYSNTNNDTIPYTEWSTPVMLAKDGLNTATVFLYQRKSPAPNKPSTSSTYTFSTKDITGFNNGWSTTIQAANSASGVDMSWPLYVTQATAASTSDQDTIEGSEWASPTILVENGAKGDTGPQGPAGKGISSITEYYALNNSTTAPADSSFSTTVKTPTASNKYVWNYELITYTDSTTSTTTKHIVATYGDTGTAGKGISSITEYYAINNSTTAPADSAFGTSIVQPTSSNRYLWNYEKITYTDSTTTSTGKRVIGVYGQQGAQGPTGATGVGVDSIVPEYYLSTSASTPTGGSWSTTAPAWTSGKYIFTRSHIYWDDGSDTTTDAQLDNAINDLGTKYASINTTVSGLKITATNGTTSSTIKLMSGSTQLSSQTISMSGLVKYTDLSGNGTTTIDGSNIKTGTISADRIDVTSLKVKEIYGMDAMGSTDVVVFNTDASALRIGHYVGTPAPSIHATYDMELISDYIRFKSPFSDNLHNIELDLGSQRAGFEGWRIYLSSTGYLEASGSNLYWNGTRLN